MKRDRHSTRIWRNLKFYNVISGWNNRKDRAEEKLRSAIEPANQLSPVNQPVRTRGHIDNERSVPDLS
jgi:hypothetical protein